jgi:hypothetical protein
VLRRGVVTLEVRYRARPCSAARKAACGVSPSRSWPRRSTLCLATGLFQRPARRRPRCAEPEEGRALPPRSPSPPPAPHPRSPSTSRTLQLGSTLADLDLGGCGKACDRGLERTGRHGLDGVIQISVLLFATFYNMAPMVR